MATKSTKEKETSVAPKKCATKRTCAKKATEVKAATTKKACATKTSATKACATKKACAKKTTEAKACAPKKACAKKDDSKVATKKCTTKRTCTRKNAVNKELSESKLTMVLAKTDIGWGNVLYIRGEGADLSWEKGIAMQSVSDNEWLWEVKGIKGELEFKFLINDEVWCDGENIIGKANEIHTYYPEF